MSDIGTLAGGAHAIALDGLGEDDGGLPAMVDRGGVCRVDLQRIVAAATELPDFLISHARDHLEQLRILAEKLLAHVCAVACLERLVFAVDAFLHALAQQSEFVAREQRIPVATPVDLDDIPSRAAEVGLEFLDDLAVAAHRTGEPLQVEVYAYAAVRE